MSMQDLDETSDTGHATERGIPARPAAALVAAPRVAVDSAGWLARRVGPKRSSLLREPDFFTWWLTRVCCQTAQNALLYALLIIIVDHTDASFFSSLFVVCSLAPALVFGLPGGIVSDRLAKRPIMVGFNLVRFVFIVPLALLDVSLPGIFAATLGIWTIHQFYSPAEGTSLAAIVPRRRYPEAQSLSNLALTVAQLLGLVIMAPLLLKVAPPQVLFAVVATLYFVAAGFAALLPRMNEHIAPRPAGGRRLSRRQSLLAGWRVARADRVSFGAMADDVLVGVGLSALVVIVPFYLERVLGTAKENTVFVFAPSALGLVVGYRIAPKLGYKIGGERAATLGLVVFAACVAGLGFVEQVRTVLVDDLRLPIDRLANALCIPSLVIIAMLISIPAGFASAIVNVAARSVLLDRTPPAARSQVVATQALINNLGALVPSLVVGLAMDRFGVEPIAVALAVLIAFTALAIHAGVRDEPVPAISATPS